MNNVVVSIKLTHPDAVIPSYAKQSDGGMDLTAVSCTYDTVNDLYVYDTGVAVAIPDGYVGYLLPRSSISKTGFALVNSVGVLDAGFRGSILLKFRLVDSKKTTYKKGERVAQLVILPRPSVSFRQVEQLPESERGQGGFGSTGA